MLGETREASKHPGRIEMSLEERVRSLERERRLVRRGALTVAVLVLAAAIVSACSHTQEVGKNPTVAGTVRARAFELVDGSNRGPWAHRLRPRRCTAHPPLR